jgi:putative endonuclease
MADKAYFVYIMTNQRDHVLYMGVTNNLYRRAIEHREGRGSGFTSKYRANKLVYYEVYEHVFDALEREKQIKGGSRQKKLDLINAMNPDWRDLFDELQF